MTSMVGDAYGRTLPQQYPWVINNPPTDLAPTKAEFDALKREVQEMHELLKVAKRLDDLTDQPDCEQEDKVALLRKIATAVGIDLDDVLGAKS
jgi:hypothetical protein